jgi:hypothetical protein
MEATYKHRIDKYSTRQQQINIKHAKHALVLLVTLMLMGDIKHVVKLSRPPDIRVFHEGCIRISTHWDPNCAGSN